MVRENDRAASQNQADLVQILLYCAIAALDVAPSSKIPDLLMLFNRIEWEYI